MSGEGVRYGEGEREREREVECEYGDGGGSVPSSAVRTREEDRGV